LYKIGGKMARESFTSKSKTQGQGGKFLSARSLKMEKKE